MRVYLGVKTCEVFLCFIAVVWVRVSYVGFFVFFVSQVLTQDEPKIYTAVSMKKIGSVQNMKDLN